MHRPSSRAGFGRFGQITGRILTANGIAFTALDNNSEHIEFVKKFGNKVFNSKIPINIDLVNASRSSKPIKMHAPESRGAYAYSNLAKEFME